MKIKLFIAIMALCSVGCATTNAGLQEEVDLLKDKVHDQRAKIKELAGKAARCNGERAATTLKEDAEDALSSAWSWIKQAAEDGEEDVSKIAKCYKDGSDSVHNAEGSWKLLSRCIKQ